MRRNWIPVALATAVGTAVLVASALRGRPATEELRSEAEVERSGGPTADTRLPAPQSVPDTAPRTPEIAAVHRKPLRSSPPPQTQDAETRLEVNVVSRDHGAPIGGARVRLSAEDKDEPWLWKCIEGSEAAADDEVPLTDREGRAWIGVRAGVGYLVEVEMEDGTTGDARAEVAALAAGEQRVVLFDVPTEFDLIARARVIESTTHAPLPGASVRIHLPLVFTTPAEEYEGRTIAELEADAEGEFELRVPSWTQVLAFAESEGFAPGIVELCAWRSSQGEIHEVPLERAARLELSVTDARQQSLEDLEVRVVVDPWYTAIACNEGGVSAEPREWRARLNADGRAILDALPPHALLQAELLRGTERVWIDGKGVPLEPGETRHVAIALGAGSRLHGRLIDASSGEPIADHELWLTSDPEVGERYFPAWLTSSGCLRATTDETGAFRFDDLAPGDWWIGPAPVRTPYDSTAESTLVAPVARHVPIAPGLEEVFLEIQAHRGIYLDGFVLDSTGSPTEASISGNLPAGPGFSWVHAPDGRFRLGPLEPGTYELHAHGPGSDAPALPVLAHTDDEEPIVLRLRPGAQCSGLLTIDGARAERDAEVRLIRHRDESEGSVEGFSGSFLYEEDHEAEFDFIGVVPGSYDLLVSTRRGEFGSLRDLRLSAGDELTGLELELQSGATLELVTTTPDVWREVEVWCERRLWDEAWVAQHESDEVVLPPGLARLRILDDEGRFLEERTVSLVAGERATVDIP